MYNTGKDGLKQQPPTKRDPNILWVFASLLAFLLAAPVASYGYSYYSLGGADMCSGHVCDE